MKNGSLIKIYLKLLLTAIFWGGTFIAGKVVARDIGPFSAAFLRFAIASGFLLLFTWKTEGGFPSIKRGQILWVLLLGMTGVFAYNVFFFKGLKLIDAGRASLIIANNPVFITLFSALIFKEKLNLLKVGGIVISIIGAMIVISKGDITGILNSGLGWGEFFIFCCVASWVAYSLIGKAVMSVLSPLVSVCYSCIVGAFGLFIPACFEGMIHDMFYYSYLEWFSIFYLGFFGTVLGFVWYYEGIKTIGAIKAGQFINFVPISAVLLAFIMLGETITPSLLVGGIFVISGVYMTNSRFVALK